MLIELRKSIQIRQQMVNSFDLFHIIGNLLRNFILTSIIVHKKSNLTDIKIQNKFDGKEKILVKIGQILHSLQTFLILT